MPEDPQREALERALGAQYEIVRLLGKGGMGTVYLARERALERAVAIKVLPPSLADDAESRERFRREARTAARLTHPNIVPLYTFGDVDGMLYFVMGYVRGESLGQRLQRDGTLAAETARRILGELADALDYAHRQGIIHRDIKPDNVLLDDETGRPMLTDFGVAKAQASGSTLTEVGAIVGTPHYMSPEQASGERTLDGRSDIYSLGVMGYLMLSGRLPFEGASFRDVIVQHVSREPAPLGARVPDAPADLVAAVSRCLAKDPAGRWPDGGRLRLAISAPSDDPDDLDPIFARIQGWWATWSLASLGAGLVAWSVNLTGLVHDPAWRQALPFIPLTGFFGASLQLVIARARGFQWPAIRRMMLRPPRSWVYWYPRRWRAPGDVWDRLPTFVRRLRALLATGFAVSFALVPVIAFGIRTAFVMGRAQGALFPFLLIGGGLASFGLLIGTAVAAAVWGRHHGLPESHAASRFAFTPTGRLAFWQKPMFAALLLPASASAGSGGEPRAPRDYVDAIVLITEALKGPARILGSEATAAARQAVEGIVLMDAEMVALARDANPVELAQVEQKVSALGDAGGDNDARRKMRSLLHGQRELLLGLAAQLDAAQQGRTNLIDLLRTLWLHVASLRAETAREALAETAVSGTIRAACDEIGRYTDAAATVRLMTPRSPA